jgi:hypothetical protein
MKLPKGKPNRFDAIANKLESTPATPQSSTRVTKSSGNKEQKSRTQLLREGEMKQLKVVIDKDVWKAARVAVVTHELDMSEVIEGLLTDWLQSVSDEVS